MVFRSFLTLSCTHAWQHHAPKFTMDGILIDLLVDLDQGITEL